MRFVQLPVILESFYPPMRQSIYEKMYLNQFQCGVLPLSLMRFEAAIRQKISVHIHRKLGMPPKNIWKQPDLAWDDL